MGETYRHAAKGFAVRLPAKGWNIELKHEADLLLRHQDHQAGIVVNATCDEIPADRPVAILSRHLYFGIREKAILVQERRDDTRGEALEVVLRGETDGRELLFHGYTIKGSACIYDLVVFAPPEAYAQVNGEFEALVRRFELLRGEER